MVLLISVFPESPQLRTDSSQTNLIVLLYTKRPQFIAWYIVYVIYLYQLHLSWLGEIKKNRLNKWILCSVDCRKPSI